MFNHIGCHYYLRRMKECFGKIILYSTFFIVPIRQPGNLQKDTLFSALMYYIDLILIYLYLIAMIIVTIIFWRSIIIIVKSISFPKFFQMEFLLFNILLFTIYLHLYPENFELKHFCHFHSLRVEQFVCNLEYFKCY